MIFSVVSFSQKGNFMYTHIFPNIIYSSEVTQADCAEILPPICNYIVNNDFIHPNYDPSNWNHYTDPFNQNLIPNWLAASGSPTIFDPVNFPAFPSPPSGVSQYFFGGVGENWFPGSGDYICEGVVQKIPKLIPGHTYTLSFFKSTVDYSPYFPETYPLDFLHVTFINCSDYNATFDPHDYHYPPVPSNRQDVYCETNVTNLGNNWQQVFVHFTATSDYNMIWIWPEENRIAGRFAGLVFSFPELIDITAIQNQVIQATQPNCMATLPYCGPLNSVFNWEGPNGQTPSAPSGQPIQVNVADPLNVGTWTLTLTMPNAVTTNNTCSPQGPVTGSVNISAVCTLPTGPIKIIEVPNVQSVSPKDVKYELSGYSLIAYTSIDDISLPDPEDQIIGFGLMKLDANGNNIFNKQYKLPGKKLYVKKIIERNVSNDNHYYALIGIKDGINCTCSDQKILILKIDKTNGNLINSYKVDGFYSTSFHEPVTFGFSCYSDQNFLFITSYGYDESPVISNSKIFLTKLDLTSNQNQVYEIYDANNLNAILKPTKFSGSCMNFNNNQYYPYPYVEIGSTYQSNVGQPLQPIFTVGGDLTQGQSTLFNLDNGSLLTANFGVEDFGYSFLLIAQNVDKKIYVVTSPMSSSSVNYHVFNNPDFALSAAAIEYDNSSDSRYSNGIITSNPTLYSRLNYDRQTQTLRNNIVGQDLNINPNSPQNIFTANIDPDFSLPGTIVAQKQPLSFQDFNKFYYYYHLPTNCDIPVNFPEISGTVTKSANNTKMHISNFSVQITNVNMTETANQPINVTQICYDLGSFAGNVQNFTKASAGNFTSNTQYRTTASSNKIAEATNIQKEVNDRTNISSIEVFNTAGQLIKRISSSIEINAILNSKMSGFFPSLYFVRVIYKDNTTKTFKKFLQ